MYKHQTIEYDKLLPAGITLIDGSVDRCRGEPHWHEEMQLIYVDEGSLTVTVGNRKRELSAGDVQLINPCEVHSLKKGSAKFLSVHFSRIFVQSFFEAAESYGYVLEEGSQERRWRISSRTTFLSATRQSATASVIITTSPKPAASSTAQARRKSRKQSGSVTLNH